ncbi:MULTISPECIES: hydroxyacid dehydrogenase [unclassified Kitasatospora]|uniref:hydroxyacid dehydrogenase n=1 Tax=unclassified Kitasatospora TaxID=2633591 RepID=UPI00070D020D|nr:MULTISPECIES: hydroxyacid dehydrogenase [unclassified Kitasatospora]KQV12445.1 hydroxyacid dehydrogenase [Kitasatospora sp. Root107]KRB66944.1 hydroxyacid dehydrogenase [Kitasatospora sp. Root187]
MHTRLAPQLLDPRTMSRLCDLARFDPALVVDDFSTPEALAALADTEVIISSWGCPPIDEDVLAAAPNLRAVIHAAGSVKHHITDACWQRGIQVTSAAWANALPVAEYTVAAVLFANKQILRLAADYREHRTPGDWTETYPAIGNYRRIVGIVGASRIGRRVIELLRPYDLDLLLHDPYVDAQQATALGTRPADLDELCELSDVVSIHAPELPGTRHLIDRRRLALMKDGATLINTSRGSLIDQDALIEELTADRLNAVLDVTTPDVLPADSPLYDLPNVLLTPHAAGSLGSELHRMAAAAADELARYTADLPFAHPVLPQDIHRSA